MTDIFEKYQNFIKIFEKQKATELGTIAFFLSELNDKLAEIIKQLKPLKAVGSVIDRYLPELEDDE